MVKSRETFFDKYIYTHMVLFYMYIDKRERTDYVVALSEVLMSKPDDEC